MEIASDLIKCMERKAPLFLSIIALEVHGNLLFEKTGFRFKHSILTYKDNLGRIY